MSRFEPDQTKPIDAPLDASRDAPASTEPSSDADQSVAHIAELVRRTTESQATPRPAPANHPDATVAHPPPMTPAQVARPDPALVAWPDPAQVAPSDATVASPDTAQVAPPHEEWSRAARWQPRQRILVIAGAVVVLLIGGGLALSHSFDPEDEAPPPSALKTTATAGHTVRVTDVITDCAGHSRGKTKASFASENCVRATRLLATGQVGGRPVLFVVSRIEMATGEAAAAVKQVVDGSGTGNLNDLLRDGKTFPGAPAKMPSSGYASVQTGKVLTVAEAGFVDDGRSSNTDPALRAAAAQIAASVSAQS